MDDKRKEMILPSEERRAILFSKIISGDVEDPGFDQIDRLSENWRELAFLIMTATSDPKQRKTHLRMELMGRGEGDLWDLIEAADPDAELGEIRAAEGWELHGLGDAYQDLPPIDYLVEGVIPRPGVTIWFGSPKSFKSMLLMDMSLCVAAGLPWLENLPSRGPGVGFETEAAPVLWLDLENGLRRCIERIGSLGRARSLAEDIPFQFVSTPHPWPRLDEKAQVGELVRLVEQLEAGLLVIDHLGAVLGDADENSPEVASVLGNIRALSEEANCSVVLIHHSTKGTHRGRSPADTLRGHGSILANVDLAVHVSKDQMGNEKDRIEIETVASRGPEVEKQAAIFSYEHRSGTTDLQEARFWGDRVVSRREWIDSAVLKVLRKGEGINQTELRALVNEALPEVGDPTIREAIVRLEKAGGIYWEEGPRNSKIYFTA